MSANSACTALIAISLPVSIFICTTVCSPMLELSSLAAGCIVYATSVDGCEVSPLLRMAVFSFGIGLSTATSIYVIVAAIASGGGPISSARMACVESVDGNRPTLMKMASAR